MGGAGACCHSFLTSTPDKGGWSPAASTPRGGGVPPHPVTNDCGASELVGAFTATSSTLSEIEPRFLGHPTRRLCIISTAPSRPTTILWIFTKGLNHFLFVVQFVPMLVHLHNVVLQVWQHCVRRLDGVLWCGTHGVTHTKKFSLLSWKCSATAKKLPSEF